jgi:hypothetical protein
MVLAIVTVVFAGVSLVYVQRRRARKRTNGASA